MYGLGELAQIVKEEKPKIFLPVSLCKIDQNNNKLMETFLTLKHFKQVLMQSWNGTIEECNVFNAFNVPVKNSGWKYSVCMHY